MPTLSNDPSQPYPNPFNPDGSIPTPQFSTVNGPFEENPYQTIPHTPVSEAKVSLENLQKQHFRNDEYPNNTHSLFTQPQQTPEFNPNSVFDYQNSQAPLPNPPTIQSFKIQPQTQSPKTIVTQPQPLNAPINPFNFFQDQPQALTNNPFNAFQYQTLTEPQSLSAGITPEKGKITPASAQEAYLQLSKFNGITAQRPAPVVVNNIVKTQGNLPTTPKKLNIQPHPLNENNKAKNNVISTPHGLQQKLNKQRIESKFNK